MSSSQPVPHCLYISMEEALGEVVAFFQTTLENILVVVQNCPDRLQDRLQAAHSIMVALDSPLATPDLLSLRHRLELLHILQELAYRDTDSGGEVGIALWCERQWATILDTQPNNLAALQGKRD